MEKWKKLGRYIPLVNLCCGAVAAMVGPREIEFDDATGVVKAGEQQFTLANREHRLFDFLWQRCEAGLPIYKGYSEALDDFLQFMPQWQLLHPAVSSYDREDYTEAKANRKTCFEKLASMEPMKKSLGGIRRKLNGIGAPWAMESDARNGFGVKQRDTEGK